ncbi:MAG: M23 family metallopeptidase [Anaerolineae bacterium]|nr:M23 family metallopeptidase [Anaerolineae bacterium]
MRKCTLLILLMLALLVGGCAPSTYPATPTKTPGAEPVEQPSIGTPDIELTQSEPTTVVPSTPVVLPETETVETEVAITPTIGPPTNTSPPPTPDPSLPADHYQLWRPIPNGWADYADRTYAYGTTSGGQYRPHTGMDFINDRGTPVSAVGNATVHYAGTDESVVYGPQTNFYGNLIVLQMTDFTHNGQPVYALYGHLGEIGVQIGQTVAARDVIGVVGASGIAMGPHLHFEVRVGDPMVYFTATRNPDLWIKPYNGYGTLAGKVINSSGAYLREVALTVHGVDMTRYTWSYAGDENISDEQWKENFTLGDLPEGWYTVTTRSSGRGYSAEVYIENGRTTWLEIVLD